MPAPNLIEVHQSQLVRLEDRFQSLAVQVAGQSIQLNHLNNTIDQGFTDLGSKLDKFNITLTQHQTQISDLQRDNKQAKRWVKRISAGLAALATLIGQAIVRHKLGS